MPAPRKYPEELRERATRMALEARQAPATRSGVFRQAAIDNGDRPGTTTSEASRTAELEK